MKIHWCGQRIENNAQKILPKLFSSLRILLLVVIIAVVIVALEKLHSFIFFHLGDTIRHCNTFISTSVVFSFIFYNHCWVYAELEKKGKHKIASSWFPFSLAFRTGEGTFSWLLLSNIEQFISWRFWCTLFWKKSKIQR